MNKKRLKITLFIALFFFLNLSSNFSYCQESHNQIDFPYKCDTITRKKFNNLVRKELKLIKQKDSFTTNELLRLMKVNLSFPKKKFDEQRKVYQKFLHLYLKKIVPLACNDESLDYVPLKGMVCFSLKYKMYITIPPNRIDVACYNYYFIIAD